MTQMPSWLSRPPEFARLVEEFSRGDYKEKAFKALELLKEPGANLGDRAANAEFVNVDDDAVAHLNADWLNLGGNGWWPGLDVNKLMVDGLIHLFERCIATGLPVGNCTWECARPPGESGVDTPPIFMVGVTENETSVSLHVTSSPPPNMADLVATEPQGVWVKEPENAADECIHVGEQ